METIRTTRQCVDFEPPEEYRSQQAQDDEEWDGKIGCSFGPNTKPSGPHSLEGELQYRIWDMGIRCDVTLVEKKDEAGESYLSARLTGPLAEKLFARPVAQAWINQLFQKQRRRAA